MVPYYDRLLSSSHSTYQNQFQGEFEDGSSSQGPSLVPDDRKQATGEGYSRSGKGSKEKALAALKSHSEAERRRRERINVHLAGLRRLLPYTEKMDKASLLGEAINHLNLLKKTAKEATQGLVLPKDEDEVKVESYDGGTMDGTLLFKATVCCNYRPELFSDIRKAIDSLQLKMVNSEISTLDNRLMNVLFITTCNRDKDSRTGQLIASSVEQVLSAVVEKGSPSLAYCPRTAPSSKKRRNPPVELSTSSSSIA